MSASYIVTFISTKDIGVLGLHLGVLVWESFWNPSGKFIVMMGMCRGKKMQPIWEFFYKNVIGQSDTAGTLPSKREVGFTGVGFCERGNFRCSYC